MKPDDKIYIEEAARQQAVLTSLVLTELARAEYIHPDWPNDLIHQVSIMSEEAGEAVREANRLVIDHETDSLDDLKAELIQTAAMCLRIIKNLP